MVEKAGNPDRDEHAYVVARVAFATSKDLGRSHVFRPMQGVRLSYRPLFEMTGPPYVTSYLIDSHAHGEGVLAGSTADIGGVLMQANAFPELSVGTKFVLREGRKVIGHGDILAIRSARLSDAR